MYYTLGYNDAIDAVIEVLQRFYERDRVAGAYNKEIKDTLISLKKMPKSTLSSILHQIHLELDTKGGFTSSATREIMGLIEKVLCYNDPYWFQREVYTELSYKALPKWKKIQYDTNGKPVIPDNSIIRDGYYMDIISLDRLPKEE